MPRLELYSGRAVLDRVDFSSDPKEQYQILAIEESAQYEFYLDKPEPATDYRLLIGDERLEDLWESVNEVPVPQIDRAGGLRWNSFAYFESCVDNVFVRLESQTGEGSKWQQRVLMSLYVTPTKVTRDQYEALKVDLLKVSGSLIFDFVGRNSHSLDVTGIPMNKPIESWLGQWLQLKEFWGSLAPTLAYMARAPELGLDRVRQMRQLQGSGRLDNRAVVECIRRGFDPRKQSGGVALSASLPTIAFSNDTVEHRVVVFVVTLIMKRAGEFAAVADRECAEWGAPLTGDLPDGMRRQIEARRMVAIQRLASIRDTSAGIAKQARAALHCPLLRGLRPARGLTITPVFKGRAPYAAFLHLAGGYLSQAYWSLDAGLMMSVKRTSTLYEYWVFLQLVCAFRDIGLGCVAHDNFERLATGGRFVADLKSGSGFTFQYDAETRIVLTYEPIIRSRRKAEANNDSVFNIESGYMTPDCIVEFRRLSRGRGYDTVHVVVVDAKYKNVSGKEARVKNAVKKYRDIGSASTWAKRTIAPQIWIANPHRDEVAIMPNALDFFTGFVAIAPLTCNNPNSYDSHSSAPIRAVGAAKGFAISILESFHDLAVLGTSWAQWRQINGSSE